MAQEQDTQETQGPRAGAQAFDVVIIGAGLAGLRMLYSVRGLGLSVRVFEAADDVGGTWYWNRYPGARCDVPSFEYSYSFSRELEQEWEWTEKYATQPEILRYINHVADRFDLRRDIEFGATVSAASYDEGRGRWALTVRGSQRVTARYLVTAVGCLSAPKLPEIDGLDTFAGRVLETYHWPHEDVSFAGQRVGVIGTGSSGIQCIPLIAEQAAHLTVFQRTANFSLPAHNAPISPAERAAWQAEYPQRRAQARAGRTGIIVTRGTKSALEVSDEERLRTYAACWDAGAFANMSASFTDLMADPDANATVAEFARGKIRSIVTDPETAEALCPTGYPYGTKRVCLDTGYYATFNRPDVTLVNLRKTPITKITPRGVMTSGPAREDTEHELDTLVLATGFDAVTGPLLRLNITGRHGLRLADKWADGPVAYLGLQVCGFPNLFTVTGPGSPSIVSNVVLSIEQHVDFIAGCLAYLKDHGMATMEPTAQAEADWTRHVADVAAGTLYPRAASWFTGANVPGKPRVFLPYLGGVPGYRYKCEQVAGRGYEGFAITGPLTG